MRNFDHLSRGHTDPFEDPVYLMDIMYTLRVWNTRLPFSAVIFSDYALKRAEATLQKYDIVKFVEMSSFPRDYLVEYAEGKRNKFGDKFL